MKQRVEAARARQAIRQQSEEVHDLLTNNRYVDAQNKIQALESANPPGVVAPETQTKIAELKAKADGWLRPRFGELNDQEKKILTGLMTSFPDSPDSGSNRFRALKLQDYHLSIAVTAEAAEKIDASAGGPPSNPLERQARVMGLLLFTNYPILRHIDVELFDAEGKSLGNFAFDRDQLANMRMGAISQPPR